MRRRTAALGLAALLPAAYRLLLRQPIRTWGATSTEAAASLPGDELLEHAEGLTTRAITIDAPPAAVWPWLAQMGPSPRGGAYTYDWIENLFGLDMHSADRLLPEFQHPAVGDTIAFGKNRMRFERVEPGRVLALRSEDGNWVWSFVLDDHHGTTRLISRNRFRLPSVTARVAMLPMEPGSLVMERKMLRGIKQRSERPVPTLRHAKSGWAKPLRWGTTDAEFLSELPGDNLIADADLTATRAITIRRGADAVWPWIAQLGQGRGGFYSYDFLENLARCNIHSADRIVSEWQQVEPGDDVRLAPEAALSVAIAEPGRALVLRGGAPIGGVSSPFDFTWAFALREQPDGTTRLLVRERYGYKRRWARLLVEPVELISFVMSQKMLRGIRDRAERPTS